jgi:hypothetical protein
MITAAGALSGRAAAGTGQKLPQTLATVHHADGETGSHDRHHDVPHDLQRLAPKTRADSRTTSASSP